MACTSISSQPKVPIKLIKFLISIDFPSKPFTRVRTEFNLSWGAVWVQSEFHLKWSRTYRHKIVQLAGHRVTSTSYLSLLSRSLLALSSCSLSFICLFGTHALWIRIRICFQNGGRSLTVINMFGWEVDLINLPLDDDNCDNQSVWPNWEPQSERDLNAISD